MKIKLLLFVLLLTVTLNIQSQSIANYAVARTTGISYASIATTGNVVQYWRNQTVNQNDDNRSLPVPIGFDFWYCGVRYTTVNISVNGFIDFSSTVYDGNDSPGFPSGSGYYTCGQISYREQPQSFSTGGCAAIAPNFYNGTYLALAPMYCDLWTGNASTTNVANSIKYLTTGIAPNRVFTVEYINMDDWATAASSDYNFQVKLYETSGAIEFIYGNMLPGVGAPPAYACGINRIIAGATPAASEMKEQQTANSATFNNTQQFNLLTCPASNSKISFTPPCTTAPTALIFTSVGNISMTLNWLDNSSSELGYVIYQSTDGINYSFAGQFPPNTTSAAFTNLYASTYWWKVYAVTEGCLSSPALTGSQATLPGGLFISIATGNWNNPLTWNANAVPTLGDNVIISNGHTVTVNGNNYGCTTLTVGVGTSGTLLMGNAATGYSFSVMSDLIVNSGALFTANPAFAATHSMSLFGGDINNNGSIEFKPNATSLLNIYFRKNGNQFISGTGPLNSYNKISMDMAGATTTLNVLEVTASNFAAPNDFLTMNDGLFKFSVPVNPVTLNIFSFPVTIPQTCGLWMNSPNSIMSAQSSLNFQGGLYCTNGLIKVGNAADENLISNGALLSITNGTVEVAGRLTRPSFVAITNFSMTGGLLTLNTLGSNDNAPTIGTNPAYPFMIDVVGSSFFMSGGKIVIRRSGTGASGLVNAGYCNINCNPYAFTGGTLQIGDGFTTPTQTMKINTDQPINYLITNNSSGNAPIGLLETNLTVVQNTDINFATTLNCNSKNLTIGGNLTNNGTFTPGTNTLTFNGSSAQQIAGTTTALPVYDLEIANTSGDVTLNLNGNVNVAGTLRFTSGKAVLGNNNIIITSGNAVVGHNSSKYVVTNGTNLSGGYLQINNISAARDFPIGLTTSSYHPVLNFSNSGTVDNYNARVYNNAYVSGTSGSAQTNNWVGKTWMINEGTIGGSNVNMSLQWNGADELAGFTRANCGITHFGPSLWDTPSFIGGATGANPYQIFRNNITAFSPFSIINGNIILPIELLDFTAEKVKEGNLLNWATSSERNSNYFELQRGADAINFVALNTVKAAGNSNSKIDYNYLDALPLNSDNYYRLKMVDLDGTSKYSPVRYLSNKDVNFNVYPNPSSGTIFISSDNIKSDVIQSITIINDLGQTVKNISLDNTKERLIKLDVSFLPDGAYSLKINHGGVSTVKRFTKE